MHVLRDLTDKEDSAGALQRTIIDRILSLLPKEAASTGTKRKRVTSASRKVKEELDDYAEAITASERPQRAKPRSREACQRRRQGERHPRGCLSPAGSREYLFSAPRSLTAQLTRRSSTYMQLYCV